ncbi:MAG TPA: 8-oxoguanine deaminase [Magnetospirillaceae bacterium]|jgi:8-oxoguanine deaminase
MTRLWIKDPLAVLADGAERGVVIENDRIAALVPAGREPEGKIDRVFDAGQHVVIPGLINTHHHFYQTLTRALPAALGKELFPWLRALYPVWARIDADVLGTAVRVAMSELLLSGCTTTTDHHYVFPHGLENAIDIEVAAARELGIRVVLTRGSMNLSEKDGGLPPDSVVQDEDTILEDSVRLIDAYHQRGSGAMVQIAMAPCSPFSVTKELMRKTADLAERLDVRLHTHLAETKDENTFCLEKFGCRPLDYLESVGWASNRVWLAHGVHFEVHEFERLAKAGVSVTHCPCSNQYLASGLCPVHGMEQAGVKVGLGVDGSASNNASNLMQELRAAMLLQKLQYGSSTIGHKDALRWATQGSAGCVGRNDLGAIAPGKQADLALFKLDELRFAGATDPLAALLVCGAHHADRVMVAGQWRVEDGVIPGLDVQALIARQNAAAKKLAG